MAPSSIRSLGVRLRLLDDKVVPLKHELAGFVSALGHALSDGVFARPDESRCAFYDIDLEGACFYVIVYDTARTVYLIARFSSCAFQEQQENAELQLADCRCA